MSASSQKTLDQANEEMNKTFLITACEDHNSVTDDSYRRALAKIKKEARVEEYNELDEIQPEIEEAILPQPPPQRVREPLHLRLEKARAMTQSYFASIERARRCRREQQEASENICHAWAENQAPEIVNSQENEQMDEHQALSEPTKTNKEMNESKEPPETVNNDKQLDEDDEFDYPFLVDNPVNPAASTAYRHRSSTIMVPFIEKSQEKTGKKEDEDEANREEHCQVSENLDIIDHDASKDNKPSCHPRDPFFYHKALSTHQKDPSSHQKAPFFHHKAPSSHRETPFSHQEAPSSHQEAPSSHQEATFSHQEPPSSHQEPPSSHQKDSKKASGDNIKLPAVNKLLARLKREELLNTRFVDGIPRIVRPKSPIGPRAGYFVRGSKPTSDLEQVSEEDEPTERVLYEPRSRPKSRMRRRAEGAWTTVRQRLIGYAQVRPIDMLSQDSTYMKHQEMMESHGDEHGIEDGSPLAPGVNLRSCPGETGMNRYVSRPCGSRITDMPRVEPMRAWLSREEKIFSVYGQEQQQQPEHPLPKILREPEFKPKSRMRRRAEGAWKTVKQKLSGPWRPIDIRRKAKAKKYEVKETDQDEHGIEDGFPGGTGGTGINPNGNKPSGSGIDQPRAEPMRAWLSREERLFCVHGMSQQQQQPQEPPKPKKTLGSRLSKLAARLRLH